ncbi:MAG: helix-turn-helix domain-containing protein [Bacteroidaceae bacterium]|nr:helix-turn-helix domain-containing protein [Bacteroidaceae bacterium]
MKALQNRIFFLLFLCTMCASLGAARWQRMTTAEGLSNNQTRQIICLPDGRMMVVVEGMIDLYDGERFQPLPLNRTLTVNIHSFLNTNHYVDAKNRLWIRTHHELVAIDLSTLRPLDARHILREAGITGEVQNFFIDARGEAWIHVGEDSLLRCDWQSPARLQLRIAETNPDSLRASVCDIAEAGGYHFILYSNGRMACLDARTEKACYDSFVGEPSRGYYLRACAVGNDLVIRMTGRDSRNYLVRFDTTRRCITDTLQHEGATAFFVSEAGELWTCNDRQVRHYDASLKLLEQWNDAPIDLEACALDLQGGFWACTHNSGVLYRNPLARSVPFLTMEEMGAVQALFALPDGTLLAGTSRGLWRHSIEGSTWHAVPGTKEMNIVHLNGGHGQRLFASTRNRGLFELDSTLAVRWSIDERTDPKMRSNVDFCIELSDGRCLLNTRLNRLTIIDPATRQLDQLTERLKSSVQEFRRIVDILPVDGGWLVATQNGLFSLQMTARKGQTDYVMDTKRYAALNDNAWSIKCNCLFRDHEGHILVGTQNGLLVYDERDGSLRHYGTSEGLPNNCIQSIIDDRDGRLWMATMGGLCRLDLATGKALVLDATDGITDRTFTERTALRTADGQLLFGTEHGIYTLASDMLPTPSMTLVPQLLSVRIAGEDNVLHGVERLRLSHDRNFLTFNVSALNYAFPTHTHYRYRLVGIDRDWVTVTNSRGKLDLSYTALAPGRYRLEVQAAMQGQPWGEVLTVPVTIRPPWWQTWWAYLLYALLATALFLYLRRSYVQRKEMRRRIDELLRDRKPYIETPIESPIEPPLSAPEGATAPSKVADKGIEAPSGAVGGVTSGAGDGPRAHTLSHDARRFLEKAIHCVDKNMGNTEYTIDLFASDMAMERSTLYRRLQAVMGQSPLEFVRTIRLKKAAELLRSGKYSVTEVSELVGFNTPRYFTKHFKDMYGVRPSEYR